MPVPILRQGPWVIATVQNALTDEELVELREDLAARAGAAGARAVIIDVSLLDVVDSYAARTLSSIAQVVRLRGSETVICGIQPDVAFAMVQLGLSLEGTLTALNLEDGLALLHEAAAAPWN